MCRGSSSCSVRPRARSADTQGFFVGGGFAAFADGAAVALVAPDVVGAGGDCTFAEGADGGVLGVSANIAARAVFSCGGLMGTPGGAGGTSGPPHAVADAANASPKITARTASERFDMAGTVQRDGPPNHPSRATRSAACLAGSEGPWCNPHVRFRLLLGFLAIGLSAVGCHSSAGERTNTAADVDQQDVSGGGSDANGPHGHAPPDPVRPGAPTVTYPGFEVLPDGRSVVTVDTTGPTTVTEEKAEGRIILNLAGVSVPYKVNKLPLVTTNFPTQVSRVEVEQANGGGANVILELRETSTSTHEMTKIEGGMRLTITLPRSEKFGSASGGGLSQGATWEENEPSERRRHKRNAGDNDVTSADDVKAGEKTHTKRADRQPIPYVERHLTLSYSTLAPDVGISGFGGGSATPDVWLSSGIRFGIIDQIEVEATANSFRLSPDAAFAEPSVGATFAFFQLAVEMAGRARFYIPLDSSHPGVKGDPILELALPVIFHLGSIAKIDTGVNFTLDFDNPTTNGLTEGLYEPLPSPVVQEPGIPLKVVFQPVKAFWIGTGTGVTIGQFNDAAGTIAIPLGFQAGVTTYDAKRPNADLGVRFDWPSLFTPGQTTKVHGDVYQFAAWLRWYYYL